MATGSITSAPAPCPFSRRLPPLNGRRILSEPAMSFLDSRTHAARQGIGQPVRRAEDRRLITGGGRYSDDVTLPRQAYAAFLRSPHAHARIRSIDVRATAALPGVLAVFAGADAAELAGIPHRPVPTNPHE